MNHQRRSVIKLATSFCAASVMSPVVRAQNQIYTSGTVTVIVPFGAGSSTDAFARIVIADINTRHPGKFIIENRAGAGATIGARTVANAAPDGKTLFYSTATPFSISPYVYQSVPYDPLKSFAPIALTINLPTFLYTSKESGFKTIDELITYLRQNPNKSSYSSYGKGSSSHLAGALFVKTIGANGVLHVPYNDVRSLADLVAGRNTFQTDAWNPPLPMVTSGKLVVLATLGRERMPWVPDVPTMTSVLGQDYDMSTWHGLFAPAGTPTDILDFMNEEIKLTMAKDSVKKVAREQGFRPYPHTPRKDIAGFMASDNARWKHSIEVAGVEKQ
ncbi:Bug family tripartite tricarboxylate transporter substrate binding protein [Ottowia thiooxydans]|uniref:Bug family tripartite tricarboxylate transporter substrate binding protein n=1 Tax=Ottowia thiooxydans TaxID=219182 RepID=UPI00048E62CC|nr:tripartite tricarboxylate transporter substrate binding protein [Ottowia thiooxydans]